MLTNASRDVSFKFKDISGEPAELGLYFASANGDKWGLALWTTPSTGQEPTSAWTTYTVGGFPLSANWYDLTGSAQAALATDMTDVAAFGLYLSGGNNQVFGLGDMQLSYTVPEPETVWLILAALASLGITCRSRIGNAARSFAKRS